MPKCEYCNRVTTTQSKLRQHLTHCVIALGARGGHRVAAFPVPQELQASGVEGTFEAADDAVDTASLGIITRCLDDAHHHGSEAAAEEADFAEGEPLGSCNAGDMIGDGTAHAYGASLDEFVDLLGVDGEEIAAGPVLSAESPGFPEFREIVLNVVKDAGRTFLAELQLLQLVRRRDLSTADADAMVKTITDPVFLLHAFGDTAERHFPTCWKTITNHMRELLKALHPFIPGIRLVDCDVRSGVGPDAHAHQGRVAYLCGGKAWVFMLLDAELYAPAGLVRPVASAGQSARAVHPSWTDHVGPGGAGHPSFAAHTLAREDIIRHAHGGGPLRVVPMGVFVGIDGTKSGTTVGRGSFTPMYARCSWFPYARLHEERAYEVFAIAQIHKLSSEASADKTIAPVLRCELLQEILRASLCRDDTFEPISVKLPGETEVVLLVPYLSGVILDGGEVVHVLCTGGGGKSCFLCTCPYHHLGDPVTPGHCAGGGTFRDGAATTAWASQKHAQGTAYAPLSRMEQTLYRAKPVMVRRRRALGVGVTSKCFKPTALFCPMQLALSQRVILDTLPTQAAATRHGMQLPASLGVFLLFRPDIFHNLDEGENPKFRARVKALMRNWFIEHRGVASRATAALAYSRALDAVDRWGTAVAPYPRPGRRTITQYHKGWTTATALFGWDHVNMLYMLPMLLGFGETVLPRDLKLRVVRATEALLDVHRLTYLHGKDAAACEERRIAMIR